MRVRWVVAVLLVALQAYASRASARTVLGIRDTRFTLNGKPTFLLGLSYYGALGAPTSFVRRDLDDMQRYGINWIRVWAIWRSGDEDVSVVDQQGATHKTYLERLRWLVAECDRRGMAVDVTLSRGDGDAPDRLSKAARLVIETLRPHRNWYLDMANERNVGDKRFVSFEELGRLREEIRRQSPELPVTASQGGDIDRDELAKYVRTARVDFICPHRPRDAGSAAATAAKTRDYLSWLSDLGHPMPVHYQEPFRRGYSDWEPRAADFLADLRGAIEGGAAGWCLHNGDERTSRDGTPHRSFDMRRVRLFDQLDAEELSTLRQLRSVLPPPAR